MAPREIDVLRLLALGCTYIQIAERLDISIHTVTTYVKQIYQKLDVHSARAAIWRALELRLLSRP